MNIRILTIIFFNLFFINIYSQNDSSFLNNCKKIDLNEFIKIRKENPNIGISYIFENGKPFTKTDSDSIKSLSKKNNIKQLFYQDTTNNKIILINKILSEIEIQKQEDNRDEKLKEDEILRSKLNGTIIEELDLTDINNEEHTLESLKGKVIVLNFWFIQCKPCVAEFPDLNKLKAEFKDKQVEFFAVTFNDKQALNKFFETHNLDYKIIPNGRPIIDKFKIPHYPYNIIIDKNGKLEYINDVMVLNIFKKMKRKIKSML